MRLLFLMLVVSAFGFVSLPAKAKVKPHQYAVTIDSTPKEAYIFIKNRFFGKSGPGFVIHLPSGEHPIRLESKGYRSYQSELHVRETSAAQIFAYKLVFLPGQLKIVVSGDMIGAKVLIDGQEEGSVPSAPFLIEANRLHEIQVMKEGCETFDTSLTLAPDETRLLTVDCMAILKEETKFVDSR